MSPRLGWEARLAVALVIASFIAAGLVADIAFAAMWLLGLFTGGVIVLAYLRRFDEDEARRDQEYPSDD